MLPPELATNAAAYMNTPIIIETPGASVVGADRRRRPSASTQLPLMAAVYDTPGRRARRGSETTTIEGRAITVFTLAETKTATGEDTVREAQLVHYQDEKFEIYEVRRWAGGDGSGPAANSKTFFEALAAKKVTRS